METFGTVWNIGNCEHITLQKNMENCRYETPGRRLRMTLLLERMRFCVGESYPPRVPWATRHAWIVLASTPGPEEPFFIFLCFGLQELVQRLAKLEEARCKLLEAGNVADTEIAKLDKIIDDMENQCPRCHGQRVIAFLMLFLCAKVRKMHYSILYKYCINRTYMSGGMWWKYSCSNSIEMK